MRLQNNSLTQPQSLQLQFASKTTRADTPQAAAAAAVVVRSRPLSMSPQPLETVTSAVGSSPGLQHFQQQQQQQQLVMMSALQPPPEAGPRPGTIPLTMLIEFIIQRTYHDLTVLAELYVFTVNMLKEIFVIS